MDENYKVVKSGEIINIDIRKYIRFLNDFPTGIKKNYKSEEVIVNKDRFTTVEFDDEFDQRKAIMRNVLIEHYSDEDGTVTSRTK